MRHYAGRGGDGGGGGVGGKGEASTPQLCSPALEQTQLAQTEGTATAAGCRVPGGQGGRGPLPLRRCEERETVAHIYPRIRHFCLKLSGSVHTSEEAADVCAAY